MEEQRNKKESFTKRRALGMARTKNLKPVVPSDNLDAQDVLVVIELFEPFGAGSSGQAGLDVHFPQAPYCKIPLQDASAHKRLVPLWLIESPHQRPNLYHKHSIINGYKLRRF